MDSREMMETLVEQGYLEDQELDTGREGIGLTEKGYDAVRMLVLTLPANHLMLLFSTVLPRVLELDKSRGETPPSSEPSVWESLSQ